MKTRIVKAALAMACIAVLVNAAAADKFYPALRMDTYTDAGHMNGSFGSEETLWVTSENGQPKQIAYMTFAGITKLPPQINTGTLSVYATEVERPGKVSIYLYDQTARDIITWADQPEYESKALGSLDIQGPGWQTWNATAFVKKAAVKCSAGCPFSLVLVADNEASIGFASMEYTADEKPALSYEAS